MLPSSGVTLPTTPMSDALLDMSADHHDVSLTSLFIPSAAAPSKPSRFSAWGRRRPLILPLIALSFLSLSALAFYAHSASRVSVPLQEDTLVANGSAVTPSRLSALRGPPTSRFRGA